MVKVFSDYSGPTSSYAISSRGAIRLTDPLAMELASESACLPSFPGDGVARRRQLQAKTAIAVETDRRRRNHS